MAYNPDIGNPRFSPVRSSTLGLAYAGRINVRSWVQFAVLLSTYKFLLDISYVQVSDAYAYQSFFFPSKTLRTEITSWALLLLGIPIFKKVFDDRSPSGSILSLLILFSVVPGISVISFRPDYDLNYVGLICIYWVLLFSAWFTVRTVFFSKLVMLQSRLFYIAVAVFLSFAVVSFSYINTGLRLQFNIIEVYDIRAQARDYVAPFGLNYVLSIADNILPVLAVFMLAGRKWISFALLCVVIFINFSITGTKQILFLPVLGVAGYYGIRYFSNTYRLVIAALAFTVFCILENWLARSTTLHTLFTYRVLFIPSELHYSYYSYFHIHELLYYSQSLLKLFSSSTKENIQFLIGEFSIGDFTARGNNGLFSDAYMNLGLIGVLIYPFIITLFLRVLDGACVGLPRRVTFVVAVYAAFVLLGMTLTSALLTSGLLFLILLLYTLPRDVLPSTEPAAPMVDARRPALIR